MSEGLQKSQNYINATINDLNEILHYENQKLKDLHYDEIEMSLERWNSRWRQESLEHYLKTGWSFVLRDKDITSAYSSEGSLIGYFLAQPLLFLDGQTQSLWIEHLSYSNLEARDNLCDFAYRLSREKHFQKIYYPSQNIEHVLNSANSYRGTPWNPGMVQVLTTRTNL